MAYYVQDLMKRREVSFAPGAVVVRDDRALRYGADHAVYVAEVPALGGQESFEEAEEFFEEDEE
jgi:hypothetical protein